MCNWTLEVRDILKNIVEKRRNCSLGAISPLFHNIFYMLDFHVKVGTRFSLRDKRLFEISEVEITRVNCTYVDISDPAEITWFERMYIWFRFIERNGMYPVVVLCALTQSVPDVLCKFGI